MHIHSPLKSIGIAQSHVSEAFTYNGAFIICLSVVAPLSESSIFWPLNHGAYYSSVRAKHFLTTGRPAGTEQRAGGTCINIIIQPRSHRPRGQTAY